MTDYINPKTYAQSKKGRKYQKRRDYRYGGCKGRTVEKENYYTKFDHLEAAIEVDYQLSAPEITMLRELKLDPVAHLPKINKRKGWAKIEDALQNLEIEGKQTVDRDHAYFSEHFTCYAVRTDVPIGKDLNELYSFYQKNKRAYEQKYWEGPNSGRDKSLNECIVFSKPSRFLPHGLIHSSGLIFGPYSKSHRKHFGNHYVVNFHRKPHTVVAFGIAGVVQTGKNRKKIARYSTGNCPSQFVVQFKTAETSQWQTLMKEGNETFLRNEVRTKEEVFEIEDLLQGEEVTEICIRACNPGAFQVRVYGTKIVDKNETEATNTTSVGSIRTHEWKDLILRVPKQHKDCNRLRKKRRGCRCCQTIVAPPKRSKEYRFQMKSNFQELVL